MITWQEWCYIIGGYLSGSVLYSYLLPKALKGIDITAESPDGNPGTANAFTCAGIPIGILVLCMELLKGYLPVHLALRRGGSGTMEFCTDSGGSGFWTCLSVLYSHRKVERPLQYPSGFCLDWYRSGFRYCHWQLCI